MKSHGLVKNKTFLFSGAVALIAGILFILYSSVNTADSASTEVDEQFVSTHQYIELDPTTVMSKYDYQKMQAYVEKHGKSPLQAVEPEKAVSFEEAMAVENAKLGNAPEKEFW